MPSMRKNAYMRARQKNTIPIQSTVITIPLGSSRLVCATLDSPARLALLIPGVTVAESFVCHWAAPSCRRANDWLLPRTGMLTESTTSVALPSKSAIQVGFVGSTFTERCIEPFEGLLLQNSNKCWRAVRSVRVSPLGIILILLIRSGTLMLGLRTERSVVIYIPRTL